MIGTPLSLSFSLSMLSGRWLGVRSPADKSIPAPHGSGEGQDDHRFVDFRPADLRLESASRACDRAGRAILSLALKIRFLRTQQ
jgi:hypothetical protein